MSRATRALVAASIALGLCAPAWSSASSDRRFSTSPPTPTPTPIAAAPSAPRPDPDAVRYARASAAAAPDLGRSAHAIAHYLASRRKVLAGDLVGATEELRLAVAYDDRSAELHAAYADALSLTGRLDAAAAEARLAIGLDAEGRAASHAHVLLARLHEARGEPKAALEDLARARAIEAARAKAGERGDPTPWTLAAELQLQAGDLDAALALAREAGEALGHDGGLARELGRTILEKGDPARAARALTQATALRRGDEEAWHLLAQAEEAQHRPAEAREAWLAGLRLDPEDPDVLQGLGRLALQADDAPAAREWFGRLLRLAGDDPGPFLQVAYEWLDAHHAEEALAASREGLARASEPRLRLLEGLALQDARRWAESAAALEHVPAGAGETWFSARQALSYSLTRAGRAADAVAALAPALKARPGDPRLVSAQAQALARAGRGPEALELVRAVLAERERAGERTTELWLALADVLVREGRPDEAAAELEQAVRRRPREPALRYALGTTYERAGRAEEAVRQMRELLAIDPQHAEALNFVGYTLAEQGVQLEEAEALVRRALALSPRSGHMIDSLGWIRFRRGDVAGAIPLLEQADRLIGPDPSVLDHLGDAYRAAARPADASTAWRSALRNLGDEPPADQVALRAALERKLRELAAGEPRPLAR